MSLPLAPFIAQAVFLIRVVSEERPQAPPGRDLMDSLDACNSSVKTTASIARKFFVREARRSLCHKWVCLGLDEPEFVEP